MINTIATTHHSAPRSQARFTESAPENIWEAKLPPIVLLMACIIMASNTLPRVLLNSQAKVTVHAIICTISLESSTPVIKNGRCQRAHSTPKIRAAKRAELPFCKTGKA